MRMTKGSAKSAFYLSQEIYTKKVLSSLVSYGRYLCHRGHFSSDISLYEQVHKYNCHTHVV